MARTIISERLLRIAPPGLLQKRGSKVRQVWSIQAALHLVAGQALEGSKCLNHLVQLDALRGTWACMNVRHLYCTQNAS